MVLMQHPILGRAIDQQLNFLEIREAARRHLWDDLEQRHNVVGGLLPDDRATPETLHERNSRWRRWFSRNGGSPVRYAGPMESPARLEEACARRSETPRSIRPPYSRSPGTPSATNQVFLCPDNLGERVWFVATSAPNTATQTQLGVSDRSAQIVQGR